MNRNDNDRPDLDDPRVVAALDEYLAALESKHKPDRQAFLARHSAIAGALAECLEGMEALHEASSPSQPVFERREFGLGDWQPGAPLGDYRILREVGRGGMGVVYEAEQLSLGRRIALKVLPFALTLDPRQLQRFKNEARAAAQLHHQHIVPVYAVGSERGVHFYAMQFIEGQSLAEVIHDIRRQEGPTKSVLGREAGADRAPSTGPYLSHPEKVSGVDSAAQGSDTAVKPIGALATSYSANSSGFYRTVARLGVQAAEALEHAHDYGVVHRDIKPGNLMVDAHGHLWITDFGLAQFQSDAGLTQTGDLLGTLRYMSPEQAGGQSISLDHRTDIYSLGATLYELLTQHPPFEGGDRQTLLHQILNDEPRPPRAHRKSIPVELETIVLKALAKSPNERYGTARALADDLSRFLNYQPIQARRATVAQRLRKWARRHPSVVWAAVLLCLITAAGSLVGAEMLRREQKKTQDAYLQTEEAYQREKQRAQEAEEEFKLARDAVDGMFKLYEEELADKPFLDGLRRRLLQDYFLVYYQKLIEQRRDDPEAQAYLSGNRARVLEILDNLAELKGVGQYLLLYDPAVVEDLPGTTTEQRQQIREWTADMNKRGMDSIRPASPLTPEQRSQRVLNDARLTEREAQKILTLQQRQRLRQIDLQLKGTRAFEETEVLEALHLDATKREQIRSIQVQAFLAAFDCRSYDPDKPGRPGGPPPDGPFHRPRPESRFMPPHTDPVEQIEREVLTTEQRERWRELTGRPFKGRGRPPMGRFGPPAPPPPR